MAQISRHFLPHFFSCAIESYKYETDFALQKSRNGDTLGPVELIVWPEQGNRGDWHEQDG